MTKNKLKKIFERSKSVSRNFNDLEDMLQKFPPSLRIVRFAVRKGRKRFGRSCNMTISDIKDIEDGKRGLGDIRIKRIVEHLKTENPNFSWKFIFTSHKILLKISKSWFKFVNPKNFIESQPDKERLRNSLVKMLKSLPMDRNIRIVDEILTSLQVSFEREAPIEQSKMSSKMIVADFAIPNGIDPKIIIDVTSSKMKVNKRIESSSFLRKLVIGHRLKKFLPQTKLILICRNDVDDMTKQLLLEVFDSIIILEKDFHNLSNLLKVVINANQN